MRHFLCDNDILQIKYYLNGLMSGDNLILLEKRHPEVLKIGTFCVRRESRPANPE